MRKLVICAVVLKIILQASSFPSRSSHLNTTQSKNQNNIFDYHINTNEKTYHKAAGYVRNVGGENIIAQQGMYEVHYPDNQVLKLYYVADENGYVVKYKQQLKSKTSENIVSGVVKPMLIVSKLMQPESQLIPNLRIVSPAASSFLPTGPSSSSQSDSSSSTSSPPAEEITTDPIFIDTREPVIDPKAIGSLVG